jgi:hypothetical protein
MGPPSYMRSVGDRNFMRCIAYTYHAEYRWTVNKQVCSGCYVTYPLPDIYLTASFPLLYGLYFDIRGSWSMFEVSESIGLWQRFAFWKQNIFSINCICVCPCFQFIEIHPSCVAFGLLQAYGITWGRSGVLVTPVWVLKWHFMIVFKIVAPVPAFEVRILGIKTYLYFCCRKTSVVYNTIAWLPLKYVIWLSVQPEYLSRYSDSLRDGRCGDRIPVGGEISRTRPDRPWGQPSPPIQWVPVLSREGKGGGGVALTTHPI